MPSWMTFGFGSAVFAALVAIFGKLGVARVDSTLATALRSIVMAIFLSFVTAVSGKFGDVGNIERKALVFIVMSGLAGAMSWLCYFFALKNGPATAVAVVDRLSVVFVLVLATIFLGEGWTWKTLAGVSLVALGSVFVVLK